jgi:hypothetical protein
VHPIAVGAGGRAQLRLGVQARLLGAADQVEQLTGDPLADGGREPGGHARPLGAPYELGGQ